MTDDPLDGGLFTVTKEPTAFLRDRFGLPPFSVISRRDGGVIERDRAWRALGIESEVGRDDGLTFNMGMDYMTSARDSVRAQEASRTSIFSPTVCEFVYRNFTTPGSHILDPFAGGSVRGVVASALGRIYTGIELRPEQVEANVRQAHLAGDDAPTPCWIEGDSAQVLPSLRGTVGADLVFSCPPYAYLEEYSKDPADLSNMPYPQFRRVYRRIIADACALLRPDRFAVWVIGEVRDKRDGTLLGLMPDTVAAFEAAGLRYYNDNVLLTPIGTAAVRTPKQWTASRKAGRIHEYMLIFVKGDPKRAAKWLNDAGVDLAEVMADMDDDGTPAAVTA